MRAIILIVDGEASFRSSLKAQLEKNDSFQVFAVSQEDEALALALPDEIAILVTHLFSKERGEWVRKLQKKNPHMKMIAISDASPVVESRAEIADVIGAFRLEALDYLERPLNMNHFWTALERGIYHFHLDRKRDESFAYLTARLKRIEGKSEDNIWYISKSTAMAHVNDFLTHLRRDAMQRNAHEIPVLLTGEEGAGQEGIARMIHSSSGHGQGPWSTIHCAGLSSSLMEIELFGQQRSEGGTPSVVSYGLFELTHGGTIFFEGIDCLDLANQEKLYQAIETRHYTRIGGKSPLDFEVRVVASSSVRLGSLVQSGKFNEKLFQLFADSTLQVPSLRDRQDDIVPMAIQFAEYCFRALGKEFRGLTSDSEAMLREYSWPGNVRELYHLMHRAAAAVRGHHHLGKLNARSLFLAPSIAPTSAGSAAAPALAPALVAMGVTPEVPHLKLVGTSHEASVSVALDSSLSYTELKHQWSDSFEKQYLISILSRYEGNVSAAARESKLDRSNFLRLLRRHGLHADSYRKIAA